MYVVRLVVFFLNDTATTEIYPLPLHDALPIGDRLWEVDSGLFWIVAAVVRVLADDELGTFWDRARAASHERGSVFADRKSTRLNSSHANISYAVFCLKKKTSPYYTTVSTSNTT